MEEGKIVNFNRSKYFTNIRRLGSGGTGETYLFKDETTNINFAIKKYVPLDDTKRKENYKRFVNEISILFKVSHPNIVRIYNYYLYPENLTGYLQMEYIDGYSIDSFKPDYFGADWNKIFKETISAFMYLEEINILHRDIRPSNILITNDGIPKIIDFGFGKEVGGNVSESNSVVLNWPATVMPEEITLSEDYTHATEIYFVGNLFKKLVSGDEYFNYHKALDKMVQFSPEDRYSSFKDVASELMEEVLSELDFTYEQKSIYQLFADGLLSRISCYTTEFIPLQQINTIISKLGEVLRASALETFIQDNSALISCFVKNRYRYYEKPTIDTDVVRDFYRFFSNINPKKQSIILQNINMRLAKVKLETFDDIPF